jgi:hypothetical protein
MKTVDFKRSPIADIVEFVDMAITSFNEHDLLIVNGWLERSYDLAANADDQGRAASLTVLIDAVFERRQELKGEAS